VIFLAIASLKPSASIALKYSDSRMSIQATAWKWEVSIRSSALSASALASASAGTPCSSEVRARFAAGSGPVIDSDENGRLHQADGT
jgi:hypothetical protein